jgi:hypothetical protein
MNRFDLDMGEVHAMGIEERRVATVEISVAVSHARASRRSPMSLSKGTPASGYPVAPSTGEAGRDSPSISLRSSPLARVAPSTGIPRPGRKPVGIYRSGDVSKGR